MEPHPKIAIGIANQFYSDPYGLPYDLTFANGALRPLADVCLIFHLAQGTMQRPRKSKWTRCHQLIRIYMPDQPFKLILDRDKAEADVREHFQPQVELLADLVNYGTDLIPRAYSGSQKTTVDVVVCGVLLKQLVAMIDAIEVLIRSGVVHAAFLQARAALEASLYLEWILFSDSEHKANCYVVATLRQERIWAMRSIRGSQEAQTFDPILEELGVDIHALHPSLGAEAEKYLNEVNRNLSQPPLKAIDEKFNRLRKKRKHDVEWYSVAGAETVRKIARDVGRLPLYEFLYSKGSQATHSGLYKDHVRFGKGEVRFRAIRHLRELDELLTMVIPVALGTYHNVLRYYRPGELRAFASQYLKNWRKPFFSIKRVQIAE